MALIWRYSGLHSNYRDPELPILYRLRIVNPKQFQTLYQKQTYTCIYPELSNQNKCNTFELLIQNCQIQNKRKQLSIQSFLSKHLSRTVYPKQIETFIYLRTDVDIFYPKLSKTLYTEQMEYLNIYLLRAVYPN